MPELIPTKEHGFLTGFNVCLFSRVLSTDKNNYTALQGTKASGIFKVRTRITWVQICRKALLGYTHTHADFLLNLYLHAFEKGTLQRENFKPF